MRVLIITYHFPPDAEVGAVRPYQFARLLPQHGIEPWILTVQTEFIERREKQVAIDVPAEHIIRTPVGQTRRVRAIRFASHLKNSLKNSLRPQRAQITATPAPTAPASTAPAPLTDVSTEGFLRSTPFLRLLLAWLWFPDPMAGWYAPALKAGDELLGREKFDAIFSTSPPRVVHSIALELARRHNLPWIMDLRDPWYKDVDELNSKLLDSAYERLFLPCLSHADKIVLNTNRLLDDVVQHYPRAKDKSIAIPNGCRINADEKPPETSQKPKQFSIGHYGSVYSKRDPGPFLRGLKEWLAQKKAAGESVPLQMRFIGPEFGTVPEIVAELGLESIIQLCPPVPREELSALMDEDYVLLLLANKQPLQIPGKLYEYLAARRRILASADEAGATADLLKEAQGAATAYSEQQVIEALDQFWQEFKDGQAATISNEKLLQECSYASRTARLAEELLALRH
jgi:glycosyltransferase involved in cell wall biosynthesis